MKKIRTDPKKIPYWDEEMTQYILDAVSSADETIIKQFSDEEKFLLRNISSTSLEQKLHLLGKLGKRFALVIADRGRVSNRPLNVKSISQWFRDRILNLIGPTLKSWGIFVRADKELMQNLSRLSLDINPKTMYILRNYEEIAQHAENITDLGIKVAVEQQTHVAIDRLLAEAYGFLHRFDSFEHRRYKVSKEHVPVFFYLSYNRSRFISVQEVSIFLGIHNRLITSYLNSMVESGHVQEDLAEGSASNTKNRDRVFQLTGYGVVTINKMRERITSPT